MGRGGGQGPLAPPPPGSAHENNNSSTKLKYSEIVIEILFSSEPSVGRFYPHAQSGMVESESISTTSFNKDILAKDNLSCHNSVQSGHYVKYL